MSVRIGTTPFGNVVREAQLGIVEGDDAAAGDDETITVRTYAIDASQWIVDRVATVRGESVDGTRMSEERTFYDGPAFEGLPLGTIGGRGDITRVDSWIEGTRFADEARYERDDDGNAITILDARGARREIRYGVADRTFPTHESIGGDTRTRLVFRAEHDRAFGVLTSFTEPNGHVTEVRYDALGRTERIIRPGDDETHPTQRFQYTFGAPVSQVRIEQRQRNGEDDVVLEIRHVDGLGRARGTFMRADDGRWAASGLTEYGARGWSDRSARPTFEGNADWVAIGKRGAPRQEYDSLGRTLRTVDVDGAETRSEYGALWRREWDANDTDRDSPHYSTPTTYFDDGLARVRRVVQLDERREVPTFFDYDALGNLTRMIDAEMRVRRYLYDGRSRRTRVEDPNAGTWRFEYTDAGDLRLRHDPAGHRVRYEYDPLGRPLEEWHQLAGDSERRSVLFHYDEASDDHPDLGNVLGQLAWVEDDAGMAFFGYDTRGRLTDRIRRFADGEEYVTWTDYDAADRPIRRGFPDATHFERTYDARGLLRSVSGVISDLAWTAWDALDTAQFGNGVVDRRAYDHRQRLERMTAGSEAGVLRDLEYRFDRASRITSRLDHRPGVIAPQDLTFTTLEYDDLYRLVRAVDRVGETQWSYDDVANILSVASTHDAPFLNTTNRYGEDRAGPDQLTHWGDERFEYDDAGRVIWDGERTFEWDAEGRLARVTRDEFVEEYVYGFDDVRAVKRSRTPSGTEETLYVDRDLEIRAGDIVRYVFVGAERIVRVDDVPADPTSLAASVGGRSELDTAALTIALGALLLLVGVQRRRGTLVLLLVLTSCGESTQALRERSQPILSWPASAVLYVSDLAATPVALADARGMMAQATVHHPYGATRGEHGEVSEPYGYVGNERDSVSGLSDFGARPYLAELGRFLAPEPRLVTADLPDPSTEPPRAFQTYSYGAGDPLNSTDVDGLRVTAIGISVSFSGGGFVIQAGFGVAFEDTPGRLRVATYGSIGIAAGAGAGASVGIQVTSYPHPAADFGDFGGTSIQGGGTIVDGAGISIDFGTAVGPGARFPEGAFGAVTFAGGGEVEVHVGGGVTGVDVFYDTAPPGTPSPRPPTEPSAPRPSRPASPSPRERAMDAGVRQSSGSTSGGTPRASSTPPAATMSSMDAPAPEAADPCGQIMSCE